jgi:gamma-tubulin complex component 5
MLQQFLVTIFDKLDKGNPWDDDFELNTLLQVIHYANLVRQN